MQIQYLTSEGRIILTGKPGQLPYKVSDYTTGHPVTFHHCWSREETARVMRIMKKVAHTIIISGSKLSN